MRCPLWVKSGQTVPGQNLTLSAFVRKRTKYCDAANGAKRKNANKELFSAGSCSRALHDGTVQFVLSDAPGGA